jgi:hypothetical protein
MGDQQNEASDMQDALRKMQDRKTDSMSQIHGCEALWNHLLGLHANGNRPANADVKEAVHVVVAAMNQHMNDARVQEAACKFLCAVFAFKVPRMVQGHALSIAKATVQALKTFNNKKGEADLQAACMQVLTGLCRDSLKTEVLQGEVVGGIIDAVIARTRSFQRSRSLAFSCLVVSA